MAKNDVEQEDASYYSNENTIFRQEIMNFRPYELLVKIDYVK